MLDLVAQDLSSSEVPGEWIIHSGGKTRLDTGHFFTIEQITTERSESPSGKGIICYIDGGNAPILETPSQTCQLIRTCAVMFEFNRRIRTDRVTSCVSIQTFLDYMTFRSYGRHADLPSISLSDPNLKQGDRPVSHETAAGVCRIIAEFEEASKCVRDVGPGGLIIIEGDLSGIHPHIIQPYNHLVTECNKIGCHLIAVAKTTSARTETGESAPLALSRIQPPGTWGYTLDSNDGRHRIFAKLCAFGRHAFMLSSPQPFTNHVLGQLVSASKDLAFPGYPYGLMIADQLARISQSEQEAASLILTTKTLHNNKELSHALSGSDSHAILDSLQF